MPVGVEHVALAFMAMHHVLVEFDEAARIDQRRDPFARRHAAEALVPLLPRAAAAFLGPDLAIVQLAHAATLRLTCSTTDWTVCRSLYSSMLGLMPKALPIR